MELTTPEMFDAEIVRLQSAAEIAHTQTGLQLQILKAIAAEMRAALPNPSLPEEEKAARQKLLSDTLAQTRDVVKDAFLYASKTAESLPMLGIAYNSFGAGKPDENTSDTKTVNGKPNDWTSYIKTIVGKAEAWTSYTKTLLGKPDETTSDTKTAEGKRELLNRLAASGKPLLRNHLTIGDIERSLDKLLKRQLNNDTRQTYLNQVLIIFNKPFLNRRELCRESSASISGMNKRMAALIGAGLIGFKNYKYFVTDSGKRWLADALNPQTL